MSRQSAPQEYPAANVQPYQYWALVERVVDGDTLDLTIEAGFEISVKARVRIIGIDTPEMHGVRHDSDEYRRGLAARDRVQELVPDTGWVEIRTFKSTNREKYGRWLCAVYVDGVSIGETLVMEGLASAIA